MAIERKNSFHLLLSDDELALLRLLAEREGLTASDFLRTMLRRLAGTPAHIAQVVRLGAALGGQDFAQMMQSQQALQKAKKAKRSK